MRQNLSHVLIAPTLRAHGFTQPTSLQTANLLLSVLRQEKGSPVNNQDFQNREIATKGSIMNSSTASKAQAPAIQDNILMKLMRGEDVPNIVRKHKETAKIGNPYFEYVQDTSLQEKGANSYDVAAALSELGLIDVNYQTGFYTWKVQPLTRGELLSKFSSREAKVRNIR